MRTKFIGFALSAVLFALCLPVEAQQAGKIPRIGFLSPTPPLPARMEAFRQGLRDLGYIEGKNIAIEYRNGDVKAEAERLPDLAAELVRLKVDVIVTTGTPAVLAIKKASATMPIVFAVISHPVENGIVASFARPGGNITGLTILTEELSGKRLELLKEIVPGLSRVTALSDQRLASRRWQWPKRQHDP